MGRQFLPIPATFRQVRQLFPVRSLRQTAGQLRISIFSGILVKYGSKRPLADSG